MHAAQHGSEGRADRPCDDRLRAGGFDVLHLRRDAQVANVEMLALNNGHVFEFGPREILIDGVCALLSRRIGRNDDREFAHAFAVQVA